MSREIPNELEERRVIRLLAGAADAVRPLHDVEVETLVRVSAARSIAHPARRRLFLRRPQLLTAAALAAASVLALTLPMRGHEAEPHSTSPPVGFAAHPVAFPEGSALSLLLSRPTEKRA